jgi:hypothetical protein
MGVHLGGEEGSVFILPVVQCKLRILTKKGITTRQSWWQGISILVGNLLAEIHGCQEIEGCGYHPSNKKIIETGGNQPENFVFHKSQAYISDQHRLLRKKTMRK